MKQITVALTNTQEQFLRQFAAKQYEGAKDNLITATPIHTVQTQRKRYTPYSSDLEEYYDSDPQFCIDEEYVHWYKSEVEAVIDYFKCNDEMPPFEIKPYKELECTVVDGVNGEDFIGSYDDYFRAYGIEFNSVVWVEHEWEDVAFFFIREEAIRYLDYQRHNLSYPRVYTHGLGYANHGDMPHFRALLMTMGEQLNSQTK